MDSPPLRIVFAGTPEFAAIHLQALLASQHQVVAVYTQPDRPAGRGKKLQASPVKQLAQRSGVAVRQPASLRNEQAQGELAAFAADVMVVVAYGLILPRQVLDAPRLACLNVHASLLPRWRGAAPIQRAIEAGDTETGVTIMQMDAGLDTGSMLAVSRCPIHPDTTAGDLHHSLAGLGAPLLLEVLDSLPRYLAGAQQQDDGQATYANKISKAEAEIRWHESAKLITRKIRAFNPFPVAFSLIEEKRVKIYRAEASGQHSDASPGTIVPGSPQGIAVACGEGLLHIHQLQLPGGKILSVEQVMRAKGALFAPGKIFNAAPASP